MTILDCFGLCGANRRRPEPTADDAHSGSSAIAPAIPADSGRSLSDIRPERSGEQTAPAGAHGDLTPGPIDTPDDLQPQPIGRSVLAIGSDEDQGLIQTQLLRALNEKCTNRKDFNDFVCEFINVQDISAVDAENLRHDLINNNLETLGGSDLDFNTLGAWKSLGDAISRRLVGEHYPDGPMPERNPDDLKLENAPGIGFLRTLLHSAEEQVTNLQHPVLHDIVQNMEEDWDTIVDSMPKALQQVRGSLGVMDAFVMEQGVIPAPELRQRIAAQDPAQELLMNELGIAKELSFEIDIDEALVKQHLLGISEPLEKDLAELADDVAALVAARFDHLPKNSARDTSSFIHNPDDDSEIKQAGSDLRTKLEKAVPTPAQCEDRDRAMDTLEAVREDFINAKQHLAQVCHQLAQNPNLSNADLGIVGGLVHIIAHSNITENGQLADVYADQGRILAEGDIQGGMSYALETEYRNNFAQEAAITIPNAETLADLGAIKAGALEDQGAADLLANSVREVRQRAQALQNQLEQ